MSILIGIARRDGITFWCHVAATSTSEVTLRPGHGLFCRSTVWKRERAQVRANRALRHTRSIDHQVECSFAATPETGRQICAIPRLMRQACRSLPTGFVCAPPVYSLETAATSQMQGIFTPLEGAARDLRGFYIPIVAVRPHRVWDQMIDRVAEIRDQFRVQGAELCANSPFKSRWSDMDHHGCAPLAWIQIGIHPMLSAQRYEDMKRRPRFSASLTLGGH